VIFLAPSIFISSLLALPELFLFTAFFIVAVVSGIIEQQALLLEKFRASRAET